MNNLKVNPRLYDISDPEKMIERQELEGKTVELYTLNDYPDLLEEFTAKGKFAVWSSYDGENYRIFIEEGYYAKLKALYSKPINKIWLDFWDECEKISKKNNTVIIGIVGLVVLFLMVSEILLKNYRNVTNIVFIIFAALCVIGMIAFGKLSKQKIKMENAKSIDMIKKNLGDNKFENLLKAQRTYIDEYFQYEDEETEDLFLEEETTEKAEVEEISKEDAVEEKEL